MPLPDEPFNGPFSEREAHGLRGPISARVDAGLAIRRAVLLFGLVGGLSILIAVAITAFAMHRTRRIEAHFQQIYQRASLTDLAAELVHELRNPLMALRANAQALAPSCSRVAFR